MGSESDSSDRLTEDRHDADSMDPVHLAAPREGDLADAPEGSIWPTDEPPARAFAWSALLAPQLPIDLACSLAQARSGRATRRISAGHESPGQPLSEEVQARLGRLIRNNVLVAGDTLPSERVLCEIFGVSRGTLRSALMRLSSDNLVRTSHGRGTQVIGNCAMNMLDQFLVDEHSAAQAWIDESASLRKVLRHVVDDGTLLEQQSGKPLHDLLVHRRSLDGPGALVLLAQCHHLITTSLRCRQAERIQALLTQCPLPLVRLVALTRPLEALFDDLGRLAQAIDQVDLMGAVQLLTSHLLELELIIAEALALRLEDQRLNT